MQRLDFCEAHTSEQNYSNSQRDMSQRLDQLLPVLGGRPRPKHEGDVARSWEFCVHAKICTRGGWGEVVLATARGSLTPPVSRRTYRTKGGVYGMVG